MTKTTKKKYNLPAYGRNRAVVEKVFPQIDDGVFPIKRVAGEKVIVRAHIFSDGHDYLRAELLHKRLGSKQWEIVEMEPLVNDEWQGEFAVDTIGSYVYTVRAWVDHFKTWQKDMIKKIKADQDLTVDLQIGAQMLSEIAARADEDDKETIDQWARKFAEGKSTKQNITLIISDKLSATAGKYPDRQFASTYPLELTVNVTRPRARFSSWYELFPRSCGKGLEHGTFADCKKQLPRIAKLGFDVLYFPPIHPIGKTKRKGKNNAILCDENAPGSPWAIGSSQGGHKAIHPQLGTLEDFRELITEAGKYNIEIAMDIAFQCSPDHPYVKEHPEWFRWRPDNTVQFAENPPKKYEDIIPLNFETENWHQLWEELKSVFDFWIKQGIRIFRVDNPHTKPFVFWEWLIGEIKKKYPETIFLSEAFTKPKRMNKLAKIGFDQSYTYFTWRNTKYEIETYIKELTDTEVSSVDSFRPNFWPNTPDILSEYLQYGGRPGFIIKLVLAATLSSNYGIYGPAYELCLNTPVEGREEYLDSEKYEIKDWDLKAKGNISAIIERVNKARRKNISLQQTRNIEFLPIENDMITCYAKYSDDFENITLMAVSLDPHHRQSGWVHLPLKKFGIDPHEPYLLEDAISGDKYIWQGDCNYVELDPGLLPVHLLTVRKHMRKETDFDYFM